MKYTNNHKLPESIVEAITKNTYDISQNNPNIISVTTLGNPPRIRQLTLRHWDNLTDDVSNRLWMLFGSAVHEVLQRVDRANKLVEERMFVDLTANEIITLRPKEKLEPKDGHIYISGRPDLYIDESVEDYKITSVWAVKQDKNEWISQLNCYAWFYRKLGFPVKQLRINAILRDWNKTSTYKSEEYPKIPFKIVTIPLWSYEEQEKYIQDRINFHINTAYLLDKELPICTEEERWKDKRCKDYCNCNLFCSYYQEKYMKEKQDGSI